MSLVHPDLAAVLVCPVDKGKLGEDVEASELVCTVCDRHYPVRDGIPIMLIDEAEGGPNE
ncbi:MAG: Trm112 family protein [Acidimicrobiia bacterium]